MTGTNGFQVPEYEEKGFLSKATRFAVKIGEAGLEKVFLAYHVLKDPDTPVKAKLALGGALSYVVMPLDLIPDLVPAIGFSDDISAVALALVAVAASVKAQHHEQTRASVDGLLGRKQSVPKD